MPFTTDQAIKNARAKSHPGLFPTNTCLMQVRKCFGVASKFPTAASAWRGAKVRHQNVRSSDVPRGGIPFWTGGSSGAGHIAIGLGDGLCETTDFVNRGGFGVARIDDITRVWGLHFVGWAEDVNGVTVFTPPEPPHPAPVPRKEPTGTHVVIGWRLVRQGIAELRKAPTARKAIHNRANELAAVVKKGPAK